ncbi:MAG: nucleotide sugar dehydrogenase [Nitrospina sp.]|jgi:UDP-N-acetyl-D-glucosamine dehydrogenase|nr:nucleotide sugar dehydrogenase [Nitrospina sp.]
MLQTVFSDPTRPIVCVQGLGFVGAAMAVCVASARDAQDSPIFNVIGVDLPVSSGLAAIAALNEGRFPCTTTDTKLNAATGMAHEVGNLFATEDDSAYGLAEIIVCDINLDLAEDKSMPDVNFEGFQAGIRVIGKKMRPGALVIVETTVPPGTCVRIVAKTLSEELERRGEDPENFLLAHSFERVMPGADYFDSIVNFWRVYAGHTPSAADACRAFLEKIVNAKDFPLTELSSTTSSEVTKVMENSYRAVNIAFIEEWARFAEAVGVNLFEVIEAIRKRPTHSNIRQPGFGVGGYCLTKDPLFAKISAQRLFEREDLQFPFCEQAVVINDAMPLVSLQKLESMLGGIKGKHIALFGISYRQDVADTRFSPAKSFYSTAIEKGAIMSVHDPLVEQWDEMGLKLDSKLPNAKILDAVVFAVAHREYRELDVAAWTNGSKPVVLDANDVLSLEQRAAFRADGCYVQSIGIGGE